LNVAALYDSIGQGYRRYRQPDPRIGDAIAHALGDAHTVVNVGAGAGSYEPTDRFVVAVEPSWVMNQQRAHDAAPAVQATATDLPFRDGTFDASMAILTLHHWPNLKKGLLELKRVARDRIVIVTWDPSDTGFWLTDYFPDTLTIDRQVFPTLPELAHALGPMTVSSLRIPHDCTDGFLGAYWRRPDEYLNDAVRSAISTFSKLKDTSSGQQRLRQDLKTGEWHRRYGTLLDLTELDLGYRILVCD
jgi:SAM-dependent methyltransferase